MVIHKTTADQTAVVVDVNFARLGLAAPFMATNSDRAAIDWRDTRLPKVIMFLLMIRMNIRASGNRRAGECMARLWLR